MICTAILAVLVFSALYPTPYLELLSAADDPPLVYAIIKAESRFDPSVQSRVGAIGLMQIMPSTKEYVRKLYGYENGDLFDAEYNLKIGIAYVSYLTRKYKCTETAIAAYNAGEGNVNAWLKDETCSSDGVHLQKIPFAETRRYVRRVKKYLRVYQKIYENICKKYLTSASESSMISTFFGAQYI
ncbi:MAG: lytic transglycosylase domain-containing protein, partial [Christensenellaceae bacterium]